MKKFFTIVQSLHRDENGASFIEYTVLLGVILAVSIGTISAVGGWANGVWVALPP
jgi:Flp pilus assembly pilin Flp